MLTPMAPSTPTEGFEQKPSTSEAFQALTEALRKQQYLEDNGSGLTLSAKAYELVFEDVLPEVEQALTKGEHDALVGKGDEGETVGTRKYRPTDRFRDIAVGATVREMAKHRRRRPETADLRVSQFLPQRSLSVAIAIDSSRSMASSGKLLYAKKAAIGLALAAARKGDRVGVVAFSDVAQDVADITKPVDCQFIKKIAGLRPLNSTNVEDALRKSRQLLRRRMADDQKHIILVTDGVPTSCMELFETQFYPLHTYYHGNYFRGISTRAAYAEAKRCLAQGITISAICIERDEHVDPDFCQSLSRLGKGQAYFLRDEKDLLRTALQEYRRAKYS